MRRGRLRNVGLIALLAAAPIIFSSCLEPPGSYSPANPGIDEPDPAMQPFGNAFGAFTQVIGGESCVTVPCAQGIIPDNFPTYTLLYPPAGHSTQNPTDAMPGPHFLKSDTSSWAPSVIQLNGLYVLAYGANQNNRLSCIGEAYATNPYGPYTDTGFLYCSISTVHGFLDPQLFKDSRTGNVWMLFSDQAFSGPTPCGNGPDSSLWIVQMTSNGLSVSGSPVELLTWAQADSIQGLPYLGTAACVENPNIVNDVNNNYDLLFSIGTYNQGNPQGNTYVTGEVACLNLNDSASGCGYDPSGGGTVINPSNGSTSLGGGGASTLTTGDPAGNYLMYAQYINGLRNDNVGGPTTNCNPGTTNCG